jgi:hypothetical protein
MHAVINALEMLYCCCNTSSGYMWNNLQQSPVSMHAPEALALAPYSSSLLITD